jgi:hypothetical protein
MYSKIARDKEPLDHSVMLIKTNKYLYCILYFSFLVVSRHLAITSINKKTKDMRHAIIIKVEQTQAYHILAVTIP